MITIKITATLDAKVVDFVVIAILINVYLKLSVAA